MSQVVPGSTAERGLPCLTHIAKQSTRAERLCKIRQQSRFRQIILFGGKAPCTACKVALAVAIQIGCLQLLAHSAMPAPLHLTYRLLKYHKQISYSCHAGHQLLFLLRKAAKSYKEHQIGVDGTAEGCKCACL